MRKTEVTRNAFRACFDDAMNTKQSSGYIMCPDTGETDEYKVDVEPLMVIRIWHYSAYENNASKTFTDEQNAWNYLQDTQCVAYRIMNNAGDIYFDIGMDKL